MEEFVGNKELARAMGLSVRSVIRWSRRLKVPATVPGHSSNRWSAEDADKLIHRWKTYAQKMARKFKPRRSRR
jgi:hypothetical protein